ncbi:hypothetical protein [Streptomyces flavofungini]|uniref:hypothetical protein n=1 Tax=Streptomyces flavofungini TaxID=68200 RepID=UPI0025AFE4A2|nr:hypothetical protein [Streptomyces flavofungini]WJV51815.1 hypothetical protein QUY26_40620 [Streptomyces flavofungini]WJV51836.1 hypothetical protein QUY26_40725 [Streptomyces flavofungini]
MVELPEEQRAAALRQVAEIGTRRTGLLAEAEQLNGPLRAAAVEAARVGAQRSRIRELAGVSSKTLYGWLEEAGLEVRTTRKSR